MRILDLHTHILPGIDDGAADRQEALNMLENAVASQVEILVVTPHCNIPGCYENYKTPELLHSFQQLTDDSKSAKLPLQLLMGMEVHATEDLPQLIRNDKVLTINGSRYLLTEFPANATAEYDSDMLRRILAEGYIPLIAHPERYPAVWDRPAIVQNWLDLGCHVQLTAGSILGKFGRKAKLVSDFLLNEDFVACVASDAHGARVRTNFLGDVYTHLQLRFSKEYAQTLLWDNPLRICCDNPL